MSQSVQTLLAAGGDRLAVIAVGIDFPGAQTFQDFYRAVYSGADLTRPAAGWKPFGCLKRAAESAVLAEGSLEMGLLSVGPAGETNRLRGLVSGPVHEYAATGEPLPDMLAQAQVWLEKDQVQAVLLAGGSVAAAVGLPPTFGFDKAAQASPTGSGAVAVVVMRWSEAVRQRQVVLAVIDELAFVGGGIAPDGQAVQACAETALRAVGTIPGQVGYLECLACGEVALDNAEIRGLTTAYSGESPSTLLGSIRAQIGWLEGMNGLASLVRAVTCLVNQVRPCTRNWSGPKDAPAWAGSAFYVLPESLSWFLPAGDAAVRRAAISLVGRNGAYGHLLMSEAVNMRLAEPVMRDSGQVLLLIGGVTAAEIGEGLESVKRQLESGADLARLARQTYDQIQTSMPVERAVILARTSNEALRELEFAQRGVPAAAEKAVEWQTPAGSYYTPRPLGLEGQVSFVYPGAFNSYLGAGKDLFALFPALQKRLGKIAPVSSVLCEEQLYPRSLLPLAKEQMDRLEAALLDDAFAMMSSGLSLSVVQTMIFRDIFQLRPDSAFGYSLGENSMLFSMGVWANGEETSQRLRNSSLFQTRLAGPQNAVREHWGLPPQLAPGVGEELWGNFLVMAPVERVRQALTAEPRVYLTHINTPRQVVIAGDPAACRRVIDGLKCSSLRAPFNYVLHCNAMESEYAALYELHSWPVCEKPAAKLFSAADDRPFELSETEVARAVARDLCSQLDFPRLIETVYADGARIFIELGAGSNCSRWIEETLRGRPCLTVSANRKGVDDASAILRVLARLASHRAAVNLDPLFV